MDVAPPGSFPRIELYDNTSPHKTYHEDEVNSPSLHEFLDARESEASPSPPASSCYFSSDSDSASTSDSEQEEEDEYVLHAYSLIKSSLEDKTNEYSEI
eukprot:7721570-Ditylum_brightwellii.AAC.1